jgi:hypothetical protein
MNSVIASGATVIFVSHNLREVANLCQRSLLLERGQVQMIGPTAEVIRTYYKGGQRQRTKTVNGQDSGVTITRVTVHDDSGPRVEFDSGEKLYITVEALARTRHDDMSLVIQIVDDNQYPLFDTCTQRLGAGAITVGDGQTLRCIFELDLNLGGGTFHVNAFLYRYVTQQNYDRWFSATTFFVAGAPEVRGVVRLQPRLTACEVTESFRWESTRKHSPLA